MTEDQFYKPSNLYAGSKVNLAEELSRKRENRFPSEKLIKDLQDRYSDLFEAFNEGARHGFKSRDAEVSNIKSALEEARDGLGSYTHIHLGEDGPVAIKTLQKIDAILGGGE